MLPYEKGLCGEDGVIARLAASQAHFLWDC